MTTNSTGTANPSGAATVDEAANAILSLLTGPAGNQKDEEAQADDESATPEASAEEDEQPESEALEGEESDEEQAEETEDDEEQGSAPPADQTFTVRIDGKEEKVPLSELLAGYSRTSDYTRKTQAIAEQRKALEAEKAATGAERAELAQLLGALRQTMQQSLGEEPDWEKLRAEDPVRAAVEWQRWQDKAAKLARVQAKETETQAKLREQQEAALRDALEKEFQQLAEKVPEWADESKRAVEAERVRKALLSVGFTEEETELYDHRAVLLARKAALYDEMMARKAAVKSKVQAAPAPRSGVRTPERSPAQQARVRLKKSGSVEDAAAAFAALLG